MNKKLSIRKMASIAIMAALGAVLMFLDFPVPFAPPFYKADLSDLPCLIGGFALGPLAALIIVVLKVLLKLLLKPTSTAFVGEVAATIFSASYCISASFLYKKNKTKKGALTALVLGSILMVIVATIANYLFIIPAYVELYHIPLEAIIDMGTKIFPIIHDKLSFCLCCVLPFNLFKTVINGILTFVLYKHISPILKD